MPPPRPAPMPIGFLFLGMLLLAAAFGTGVFLAEDIPGPLGRILLGTVTALTLVVIEALWWVRPWVVRAVDAWSLACVAAVLLAALSATRGVMLMFVALTTLIFVGLPCAGVRWYVRDRAKRLRIGP